MNNISVLLKEAKNAAGRAYAPYSKFKVGCAILTSTGRIYSGCNVENVSYPVGTCAEAGALAAMINGGESEIKEILIYADSKQIISPCGACRQRIAEFAQGNAPVHMANARGEVKTLTIGELLPMGFKEF